MTQTHGKAWLRQHPECRSVYAAIVDQNGIPRGKRYPAHALDKLLSAPTRLPLSVCNLDIWGRDIVGSPLVFASGDRDGYCEWTGRGPVPITWLEEASALVPLTMSDDDGRPFPADPRRVLEAVSQRFTAAGLTPVVALELEFYLTVPDNGSPAPPCSPLTGRPLPPDSALPLSEVEHFDAFLNDVYRTCELQDIPLEAALSESGAGQFELNLLHVDDALKAADDAVLFKRLVHGVARRHGFAACFMARPYLDKAGNGMHVHCSVLDASGRNIFADGTDAGSDALRCAVAGTLRGLAPCALLLAPHLNSYRRLQTETHAPTRVAWGYENRTAAVRIPGGDVDAKRFEHRVAGADANPYLVLAAILGGCLHGLQQQLEPPPPLSGNAYDADAAALPAHWQQALELFSASAFNREILPLEFIELFSACKQQEIATFNAHMSEFELSTYLGKRVMFEPNNPYPDSPDHIDSYYAATRNDTAERPSLRGRLDADVCVVGAGYTGLSTALHLAENGHTVTVVEGARIGWGASGRNGGQVVNGLNAGLDRIEKRFGADVAAKVGSMMQEGGRIIRERVQRYDIRCDLKDGNIFTACSARQMRELEARDGLWRRHGLNDHELLDRQALAAHVGSDVYVGGMLDRSGGHLHPLNLALGEAAALESIGGTVYERSPVRRVDDLRGRPVVHTDDGEVHCRTLVLCGNAYLGNAVPALVSRVMPVSTQILATAPLAEDTARALLPTDCCVEDLRYILDYYRLSADRRLLFGGGSVYGGTEPGDIRAKLIPAMQRVYPQLTGVAVDYAWSGNFALSFTRVPQMGRLGSSTYFAHGYSGHGVTGSHLFGRILAEAITGDVSRFDVFAGLPWVPFPGGRVLRAPYSTLGSWWYGLRDRLGV